MERIEGRGRLITQWAPQQLILSHRSVGGFMSHCGWNSTLEALWAGKPIVAWPCAIDQELTARFYSSLQNTDKSNPVSMHFRFVRILYQELSSHVFINLRMLQVLGRRYKIGSRSTQERRWLGGECRSSKGDISANGRKHRQWYQKLVCENATTCTQSDRGRRILQNQPENTRRSSEVPPQNSPLKNAHSSFSIAALSLSIPNPNSICFVAKVRPIHAMCLTSCCAL